MFDAEEWRPVVDFEGLYEVSDQGRVRNSRSGYVLKLQHVANTLSGHQRVTLYANGVNQRLTVHRVVLEAFVGPCPEGMQGCHANDIGSDNRVSNLRWDTQSSNAYDCIANGNHPSRRKDACPSGHEYDDANTYTYLTKHGHTHRLCKQCNRDRATARRRAAGMTPIDPLTPEQFSEMQREKANRRWSRVA